MRHPAFEELEKDERVYENLREQLEKEHGGEWVIIVNGEVAAIHHGTACRWVYYYGTSDVGACVDS